MSLSREIYEAVISIFLQSVIPMCRTHELVRWRASLALFVFKCVRWCVVLQLGKIIYTCSQGARN